MADRANDRQVTDAAKRQADEAGIDPNQVEGSGEGGAVKVEDVTAAVEANTNVAVQAASLAEAQDTGERMPGLSKEQAKTLGADVQVQVNPNLGTTKARFPVYPPTGSERVFDQGAFLTSDEWDIIKNHPCNFAEGGKKILVRLGGVN